MSYKTDINGYVIVKSNQTIPINADAFTEIQAALYNDYRVVFIGEADGVYEISKPVYYSSNKTIILQGKYIVKNGLTSLVTSDVYAGATSFTVADGSLFNVGEWVAITDDAQIALYATLRGSSGKITDITGNTITFDSVCSYNYQISENAYVGHVQGVFIGENVENVKIIGDSCEINGNRENQSQIHPVRNLAVIEDQRAACGLVVYKGNNVILDGVVIKDSLMHNYSITAHDGTGAIGCYNISILNCEGYNGHDKNFLFRDVDGYTISNIIANDATWEDGFIFYINCWNGTINGVYAEGNRRSGFYWNAAKQGALVANNITTKLNTRGVYIISSNATITNINSEDMLVISSQYPCANNVLNNVVLHNINKGYCLYLLGGVENITINNLTINNCTVPAIKAAELSLELPVNVLIDGGGIYNHTGTKLEIVEGSDITFTDFEGLD